jgi:hypothetical protein
MLMNDCGTLLVASLDQPIFPVIEFCRLTGATQDTDSQGIMRLRHPSFGVIKTEKEGNLPVVKDEKL